MAQVKHFAMGINSFNTKLGYIVRAIFAFIGHFALPETIALQWLP